MWIHLFFLLKLDVLHLIDVTQQHWCILFCNVHFTIRRTHESAIDLPEPIAINLSLSTELK